MKTKKSPTYEAAKKALWHIAGFCPSSLETVNPVMLYIKSLEDRIKELERRADA